ncbi:MAG: 50S ribosomal protein L35 [Candidatus Wildermuthbacteria bacterium]|nr:50S ribosomal protein L35 [Candidatus Wildermuthbacteria bacterium]
MPKLKTRKAVTKRFKLTRTGKILRRPTGQDHYRSKQTGKQKRQDRKWIPLSGSEAKAVKKLLHR